MADGTGGAERTAAVPSPPADEFGSERLPIHPAIERLTRFLALVGGVLMLAAILITLVSVAGRYALNAPVPGDYESVEMIAAVGIFLFFPYAHATGSNIVVRFFTARMTARGRLMLDLLHDVIFAAVAALLAWRLGIGFVDKFHTGESTMLVRLPYWWSYAVAVASLVLLGVVCLARVLAAARALRQ